MTHLAIFFPGGYHPGHDPHATPLSQLIRGALEEVGAVVEIPGDAVASADALRRVTEAVLDFACATHGEEGVR